MKVKNRKCIRQLSLRSLWASRKRNIIAVVAIALTTLLFTSLFTIAMSINSSYEMYTFRQIGGYSHGTFKKVSEEQIRDIANHSKVKAVGERICIGYTSNGVFSKVPAEVSFMDDNCAKWSFVQPTTGRNPQNDKEIAMDTNVLKLLGIKQELGAEIELTYTVGLSSETAYEKTDTFTLVGWWEFDKISPVHYINVSKEYVKKIEDEAMTKGMNSFSIDLNVMLASKVNIEGQMEQINQDLKENPIKMGVNWGYTSTKIGENVDTTMVIAMIAFLALIVFTGYLIIYNIFQISVTGDIRFYGLLKTIGVTPKQLRHIIHLQAMFLCVIGIPVGLLFGYVVGTLLTPVVLERTNIGAGVSAISTSPFIFVASAIFSLITVLMSCSRPGRIASKVSPIEATKYTELTKNKKSYRSTRGAKVYQMAFANLGRNRSKTILVVVSLALSVVLLNSLITFTNGFDMEKYLEKQICADFIVSNTDYFRFSMGEDRYFEQGIVEEISSNTTQSWSGFAYKLDGELPIGWMTEEAWRMNMKDFTSSENVEEVLQWMPRKESLVGENALIEGLDPSLFEKVKVIEGDIEPMIRGDKKYIALAVNTDDYGNVLDLSYYPKIGTTQTITYIEDLQDITKTRDVTYTICAYVEVPYSMSYRYSSLGYTFVLPVDKLKEDSGQAVIPMVYLFDTPDAEAEEGAEKYLAEKTANDESELAYESKSIIRSDFAGFQKMFLLLGGVLCAIVSIVGILNFVNAIMTGILSRKREFAILQAVGMTKKQLKAMLIYEGLFYTFSSVLVALIFSFILNPLLSVLLEKVFWFFGANFTVVPILVAIPVFALLGWFIPSCVYEQASKHSIVEQIRDSY